MAEKFEVKKDSTLLVFLFEVLKGWSNKKIKERLKESYVLVNGISTTKHNFPIYIHDSVEVGTTKRVYNYTLSFRDTIRNR